MFEALLWLPVFLIALSAVIEFGMVLNGLHVVKLAARAGAKHAAELSTTDIVSGSAVTSVRNVVDRVLSSSGYDSCQVRLEYTGACLAPNNGNTFDGNCPKCMQSPQVLPDASLVPGGMIRVTVCVDVSEMTPDLLGWVGASISERVAQYSVAFPYENCQ